MTDILVRTGSLSFAYPERASTLFRRASLREVVKHVDLTVPRGSVLGLVGESGSGKTTLGRLLVRLLQPTSGGIQFDGVEIGHPDDLSGPAVVAEPAAAARGRADAAA
jgi:peptide/nickel transport system ATP-binding protein